jgi:hypothetical protein
MDHIGLLDLDCRSASLPMICVCDQRRQWTTSSEVVPSNTSCGTMSCHGSDRPFPPKTFVDWWLVAANSTSATARKRTSTLVCSCLGGFGSSNVVILDGVQPRVSGLLGESRGLTVARADGIGPAGLVLRGVVMQFLGCGPSWACE